MFGTIILDTYEESEKNKLADSIEEICSPMDSYGWSSAGIYSFWDYYTKQILYIGLAADLSERFKQHNGILPVGDNSCKYNQIIEYFKKNKKLGYSILVQSPLSQPITHRNEKKYREFLNKPKGIPIENYAGEEGKDNIRRAEGQLIEAYKMGTGDIPEWNKMGGSILGKKSATINNYYQIVKEFSRVETDNYLVARSSISEIAENPTYEWFESNLHGIRMMMLTLGMTYDSAIRFQVKFNPYFEKIIERIENENYIDKQLNI